MIQDQLKKGKTPTSLLALQQIADFMTTSMPSMYPAAPQGGMAALNMSKQINRMIVGKNLTSALSAVTMSNILYANNFPIWVFKLTFSSPFSLLFYLFQWRCLPQTVNFPLLCARFGYGDSSKWSAWLGLYFLWQRGENASLQAGCLLPTGWFVQLVRTHLQPPHSKTASAFRI